MRHVFIIQLNNRDFNIDKNNRDCYFFHNLAALLTPGAFTMGENN
jgi:hypothetical protein